MTETGNASTWSRWYEKNKEDFNEQRSERYKNDPEYREKARKRSKFYYWTKKRAQRAEDSSASDVECIELKPSTELEIEVINPVDVRRDKIIVVPGYTTGKIGDILGRTAQSIRLWIRKGALPDATIRGGTGPQQYRYYTEDQVKAIIEYRSLLDLPTKEVGESPFAKAVRNAFAKMPDGIAVRKRCKYEEQIGEAEFPPYSEVTFFYSDGEEPIEVKITDLEVI